jgi:glycosyltransferase involved in cell wall biosynthesis
LAEAGAVVEAWALVGGGETQQMLAEAGIPVRILQLSMASARRSTARHLARAWQAWQPDVVLAQGYAANLHASRAKAFGAPGRLVITHCSHVMNWRRWYLLWAYRRVPEVVICQSEPMREYYLRMVRYRPQQVVVLNNGVDTCRFSPEVDGAAVRQELGLEGRFPVIICVARLKIDHKGQDVLLRAFARLAQSWPTALLLLAGDGEHRPLLERLAQRLGVAGQVRFLGKRTDIPALLSASDIFALLTWSESDCNAVKQAGAAGKPMVTTHTDGTYFLEAERTALLVPRGGVEEAAAALARLAADQDLRHRLGQAARELMVRHFSLQTYQRRFLELMARLAQ